MAIPRFVVLAALCLALAPADRRPVTAQGPGGGLSVPARWRLFLPLLNPPAPAPLPTVVVQPGRGYYQAPVRVTLAGVPGALVYYTLDGTVPGPDNGELYREPIAVDRTTVLRAAAWQPGRLSAGVATHTYLFPEDVVRQPVAPTCRRAGLAEPCFPAAWGVYPVMDPPRPYAGTPVPADYEMDPDVVRRPPDVAAALRALPSLSLVSAPEDLFDVTRGIYANPLGTGDAWERPASAELLWADGRPGFQIDCGLRIAGKWSRMPDSTAKHSFSLRFRSRYGAPRLHYPLFPGSPVTSFDTLRLRAGHVDTFNYAPLKAQFIHDQWARDTQREMGWLSARGVFVHLYVDGLYWGLYNLIEEPTADFAAHHLGGDADDWDVIKEGREVEDGRLDAYNELVGLVAEGPPEPARYERAQAYLDLAQVADYHLLEIFVANLDWPHNNWRVARDRVRGGGFQLFAWDMEYVAALYGDGVTDSIADTAGVDGLHGWLKGSPEYRLLFADRVQRHLFGFGALTPSTNWRRYAALAESVAPGVAAESARWGDVLPGRRTFGENQAGWCHYLETVCRVECGLREPCPQLVDAHWRPEVDRMRDVFFPQRSAVVVRQLCDQGLYAAVVPPTLTAATEVAAAGGGHLVIGRAVGEPACPEARSDGVVYYTLDGTDPREAWTGRPTRRARRYTQPLALPSYAQVVARAAVDGLDGALQWSAAVTASYGRPRLAITELMYHPPEGEDHEWLELVNLESGEVDLSGMTFSGITATLPVGTRLGPSEGLVLAADSEVFGEGHPGVPVAAEFSGKLSDKGERIALRMVDGTDLAVVDYDDEGFWPLAPDGHGWSLTLDNPRADPADPEAWRASAEPGGSPGLADPPAPYRPVVLSELLARAAPPREGAIELHNRGPEAASLAGWGLSDDLSQPFKHRLPADAVIPAGGYLVVYEESFRAHPDGPGFALDPRGGTVYLTSADGLGRPSGLMTGMAYGAADAGRSFGRPMGTRGLYFVALAQATFGVTEPATVAMFRTGRGAANAGPWLAPVVLNEVMYHPLDALPEYIELLNASAEPVWLADPARPERRWRLGDGVDYTFAPGTVIAPGGLLVVTGADPELARRSYRIPAGVTVVGPWQGKLDNSGERVELLRPVGLDDQGFAMGSADGLRYDRIPPWPQRADGLGPSLERLGATRFAGDASSWAALSRLGTAGRTNTRVWPAWLPMALNDR